jgi:hypothetical protein
MSAHQSSPCIILINLGFGTTVLTKPSSMTWKNIFAGIDVLRAVAFARSSASVFWLLSMFSTVKPWK